ncbi:hypothetical protein DVK85_07200 [Flavobacterium arcticum]|uniref:LPXTG cell wall anchor domain-containing protein n=1 Tax=Flavobacterium arcticum TaxID=1784713 RepID=A0A345HBT3_9FLAO|nr:hypothetical protein [Flavobacterium arcticum]AXG74043.1 hypothetical protein DVK85_07200 [Flavobacterium arcticum]KAF2509018.1 hypothetical protein E0W72_10675 [Flavobacterium arcticum]
MNTPKTKKAFLAIIFTLAIGSTSAYAQIEFDDDANDEPAAASISGYTSLTLLLGATAGYYLLSKKSKLRA